MKLILHIRKRLAEKIAVSRNSKPLLSVELTSSEEVQEVLSLLNLPGDNPANVTKGELIAFGLINRIFISLIDKYESEVNPIGFIRAFTNFQTKINYRQRNFLIDDFVDTYAPGNTETLKKLLITNKTAGKEFIKDLVIYYLENENNAVLALKELFDLKFLNSIETIQKAFRYNNEFFQSQPGWENGPVSLIDFLKQPLVNFPQNLFKQLEFIKSEWKGYLNENLLNEIMFTIDVLKEEKITHPVDFGAPPSIVPEYMPGKSIDSLKLYRSEFDLAKASTELYEEPVNFSRDDDWMPNVVMVAKNIYVWLFQLSNKYKRKISLLNEIPDEEFEWLRNLGINALWLIGIWKRSEASRKIKHLMGNTNAIGSAYSLFDYVIEPELGGEDALFNLKEKAAKFGIKLASDMVPNHTGIFSDWIINHPEYFIQTQKIPFKEYTFNGPNLSNDETIEIKIEDGYWNRSNAAVVFKRKDLRTGEVTYIYHGNDGTNMPWNDTAQLDMLKEKTREAVFQKIIEVADKFSIIRFDAAMTLTKMHFHRLWYPKPGTGGDIPSRAQYGLSDEEFNKLFPKEFWREVVDRIKKEKPNTLLLAEAFWLMEGFFVRTLGMHRVYNSAFMHMMMNEENEKYQKLITNTLEFEPEILKRYVNFMSNPDEEPAIKLFGTGDKYFGVLTLMVTLPGLPLFAHGQIEGFAEKYGMEYRQAYYDELPNEHLIKKFKNEISPLLEKRKMFSDVKHFWLFQVLDNNNNINYNVFAFTNKFGNNKALVLYNNKYDRAFGHINKSTVKLIRHNSSIKHIRTSIADELGIKAGEDYFYIAKEIISNKEFLFSGAEINRKGFTVKLEGFQYRVFTEFEEVFDQTGEYRQLYQKLNLLPVDNISGYLNWLKVIPIQQSFLKIFNDSLISNILFPETVSALGNTAEDSKSIIFNRIKEFTKIVSSNKNIYLPQDRLIIPIRQLFKSIDTLNYFIKELYLNENYPLLINKLQNTFKLSTFSNYRRNALVLMLNRFLTELTLDGVNPDKLKLKEPLKKLFERLGKNNNEIIFDERILILIKIIEEFLNSLPLKKSFTKKNNSLVLNKRNSFYLFKKIIRLISIDEIKKFLLVNKYKRIVYFRKENFEELVDWFFTILLLKEIEIYPFEKKDKELFLNNIIFKFELVSKLKVLAEISGFKYWKLKTLISREKI